MDGIKENAPRVVEITMHRAPALLGGHHRLTLRDLFDDLPEEVMDVNDMLFRKTINKTIADHACKLWNFTTRAWQDQKFSYGSAGNVRGTIIARHVIDPTTTPDEPLTRLLLPMHVATFAHQTMWAKRGTPPEDAFIRAQWAMMLTKTTSTTYAILTDRTVRRYDVEADEATQLALATAATSLAERLATNQPPAVDDNTTTLPPPDEPISEALDALAARWRDARAMLSRSRNAVGDAEKIVAACADGIRTVVPPGATVEVDSYRITHNAQNNRITEEKLNVAHY